jgi:hypothetical protein
MKKGRREFIRTSVAAGVLGLTDASAEAEGNRRERSQRHKRPRIALPLKPKVAVISSIGYDTALQTDFESSATAVLSGVTFAPPQDKLGYYKKELHEAVAAADNDPSIGLIATAGGFVAWEAALFTAQNKPFISIVGGQFASFPVPSNASNFWGAVDLQSFSGNGLRISHLAGLGLHPSDITLLYNPNSRMSGLELAGWTGATPVKCGINPTTQENDETTFQSAFDSIAAMPVKAVIISADPFFNHHKFEMITAANSFIARKPNVNFVCYPTQNYKRAISAGVVIDPTKTQSLLYGPNLDDAYKALGTMAGTVLSTNNASSSISQPPMQYVTVS